MKTLVGVQRLGLVVDFVVRTDVETVVDGSDAAGWPKGSAQGRLLRQQCGKC